MRELVTQEATREASVLEGQRTTLESTIAGMTIESEIEAQQATDLWAELDTKIKAGEAKWKEIDQPLKEARDRLKALFKPSIDALKDGRLILNRMIGDWRKRVQEAADKANQAREAEAAARANEIAKRTGQDVEAVKERLPAPPPVEGPGAGFYTEHGAVTAAKVQKCEVVDESLIPWEWEGVCLWQLNTTALTNLRRKAKDDLLKAPPGVRFYYEETQKRRG